MLDDCTTSVAASLPVFGFHQASLFPFLHYLLPIPITSIPSLCILSHHSSDHGQPFLRVASSEQTEYHGDGLSYQTTYILSLITPTTRLSRYATLPSNINLHLPLTRSVFSEFSLSNYDALLRPLRRRHRPSTHPHLHSPTHHRTPMTLLPLTSIHTLTKHGLILGYLKSG